MSYLMCLESEQTPQRLVWSPHSEERPVQRMFLFSQLLVRCGVAVGKSVFLAGEARIMMIMPRNRTWNHERERLRERVLEFCPQFSLVPELACSEQAHCSPADRPEQPGAAAQGAQFQSSRECCLDWRNGASVTNSNLHELKLVMARRQFHDYWA